MGADIDHHHPEASDDLCNWGTWIMKELGDGAAGFRFDAVKHIDTAFISKFVKHIREHTGKPKLFAVGEFWKDSLDSLNKYLDSLGTQVSICPN